MRCIHGDAAATVVAEAAIVVVEAAAEVEAPFSWRHGGSSRGLGRQ